jgi:hypothetical protein
MLELRKSFAYSRLNSAALQATNPIPNLELRSS